MIDSHVRMKRSKVILLFLKNHLKKIYIHILIQIKLFFQQAGDGSDRTIYI